MINKEIQDYIDYLLFLKYDRQLVWSNTTIAEMSDKHLVNAIKYLEQHNPNHKMNNQREKPMVRNNVLFIY